MIAAQRRRAADLIEGLTPEQLSTPSLCGEWTVHEVAAHLLMPLVTPTSAVMAQLVRSGFNFNKASVRLSKAVAASHSGAQIAAGLRTNADHAFKPPGSGYEAPLDDAIVHQQDIRRPLGLGTDIDPEPAKVCLTFLASGAGKGIVPKSRVAGLRFEATDLDWSYGAGPVVRGPAEAVLLAIAGRRVALDEVEGDGTAVLRGRLGD
ncbi:MAG: hypothetical protein QOG49_86 [Frankiaceae bacterium]|nr:hypothetical protein [Frankiaceae bacterium]